MLKKIYNNFNLENSILFFLILFGFYLAFIGGYGSDEDTLPMIGAFESMLGGGKVMASRFTPYPVAELGIGFLSYHFGSWAANSVTFICIIVGTMLFYISFEDLKNKNNLSLFLLLCLSNAVLFFDNLEPMDYSWAFLFLSLGLFFLKKNYFELAVIFFGICIGTRIYFLLFIFFSIYYFQYKPDLKFIRKSFIFFGSFFIGGLFYLTIWYQHEFRLEWLTAVTPNHQGMFGLLARFIYKFIITLGFFVFCFLIYLFLKNKINLKKIYTTKKYQVGIFIIFSNLLLFFFIPAELSYLQPMLICFYYLITKIVSKQIIYLLIIINLSSWVVDIQLLKIIYKSNDICNNVEAIDANFDINFKKGRLFEFYESRDKIKCWIRDDSERSKKILKGQALK